MREERAAKLEEEKRSRNKKRSGGVASTSLVVHASQSESGSPLVLVEPHTSIDSPI